MDSKWQSIINNCILQDEGGWVFTDNANDPGGMTYGGMTFNLYKSYHAIPADTFKQHVLAGDNSLKLEIIECYYNEFVAKTILAIPLPAWPIAAMFSCAVNLGVDDMNKLVQKCLNEVIDPHEVLNVDGKLGPKTLEYLTRFSTPDLLPNFTQLFLIGWQDTYVDMVKKNCDAWEKYTTALETYVNIGNLSAQVMKQIVDAKPKFKRWKFLSGWLARVDRYMEH